MVLSSLICHQTVRYAVQKSSRVWPSVGPLLSCRQGSLHIAKFQISFCGLCMAVLHERFCTSGFCMSGFTWRVLHDRFCMTGFARAGFAWPVLHGRFCMSVLDERFCVNPLPAGRIFNPVRLNNPGLDFLPIPPLSVS